MNKTELVHQVALSAGISVKDAHSALEALTSAITSALKSGDKVSLVGFGSWEVRRRAARDGVNPKTGARIRIPEHDVPKFLPGKDLKDACD